MALVLALAVLALGGAQWVRWRRTDGPHGVEAVVLLGALLLAIVGILATVLGVLGVLGPGTLAIATGLCAGLTWPWQLPRAVATVPRSATAWIEPLLLVGLALALRLPFMDYDLAGRDQGTYTLRAEHTARTGAIGFVDPVLARAAAEAGSRPGPDDLLGLYPQRGEPWRRDLYEGSYRPGFYLADREGGVVVPQFFHLHPMTMTVAAWIVGRDGSSGGVVVLEGVLAVLAVLAVARRLWGAGPWPPIAAAVFALAPLVVWTHRNALTEALAGLLTWAAVLACLRARSGARDGLALAAVLLGATAWVRGNAWITAPVVLALLWLVPPESPQRSRARALYLAMLGGSVLVHASSSFPYLVDELRRQLAAWSDPSPLGIVLGFLGGALAWAAIDVALGPRGPARLHRVATHVRRALPTLLGLALAAAIVVWLARRLASTGAPHARLDLLLPGLGAPLTLVATIGLVLAVPRLRVRAAADVWLAAIGALVVTTLWLYGARNLPKTGLYYYGRYLVPEVAPLCALAAVHALAIAHAQVARRLVRWSAAVGAGLAALLVGAVGAIHVLQPQTRLQEFEGAQRVVDAIAEHVPADGIVIAGGEGWHHGHTFNQVGGALAVGHGRIVLPYVTREAAHATTMELLVHGPRARGTTPPPVFLLLNEASHAYTPEPDEGKLAALDDLLPPPLRATEVHGLELVVHRLTPDETGWPIRTTRDELRMALVRIEADPERTRDEVRLAVADAGLAITGGTASRAGHCLAGDADTTIALPPELVRDARALLIVAVPGTATNNHSWSIAIDGNARSIDPPATSPRARDTIGPLPLLGPPARLRMRGGPEAVVDAACPHGGIAELVLLGPDASALADAEVDATTFVPSSDLGHPFAATRWVAGRGLSRYRSGFALPPEIAALSLGARPGAPIRFGPEPLPGGGATPLDLVVTLTGAHVGPEARVQVVIDGRPIASFDPPDERDRSWQSAAVRVQPSAPVVLVELELVGTRATEDVVWVRDVTFFATTP